MCCISQSITVSAASYVWIADLPIRYRTRLEYRRAQFGNWIRGMPIEELSLGALRTRALRMGWIVQRYCTWNRVVGSDRFVVLNRSRNLIASDLLDTHALREWLIDTLRERRRAYYW